MNVPPFPNADRVDELIESERDPVVRSLLRLVWGEFLRMSIAGERPEGACDLLYCFTALQKAFQRDDALAGALKGRYGDTHDLEWADSEDPSAASQEVA